MLIQSNLKIQVIKYFKDLSHSDHFGYYILKPLKNLFMKKFYLLFTGIIILIFASCSSSKKVAETTATGETRKEFVAPCLEFNENTTDAFRATASATSPNLQFAKEKATGLARNALAQKIQTRVNAMFDDYANQYDVDNKEDFKEVTKRITSQVTDQMLSGIDVTCEKNYTLSSGTYEVWVGIAMPIENISRSIYDKVLEEKQIRLDYDYEKYKEKMIEEIERSK